ncbi:MAG: hypothetical protein K2X47_08360 [Bdellovibrionales bacterium]|nr:hypothetical protein [Bdellovibrionales bacterium]
MMLKESSLRIISAALVLGFLFLGRNLHFGVDADQISLSSENRTCSIYALGEVTPHFDMEEFKKCLAQIRIGTWKLNARKWAVISPEETLAVLEAH